MKKVPFYLSLLSLLIVANSHGTANASTCAVNTSAGAVSINMPNLPVTGNFNIWTRMQTPDDVHNRYFLEVNNNTCFYVGGSSISAGQWTWVSFQNGDLSSKVKYDFKNKAGNTIKLIGGDAGVRVDRVLFVKSDCTPVDIGINCQSDSTPLSLPYISSANVLPPPTSGPMRGVIIPSQTILSSPSEIAKVVYFADGRQLPTSANYSLDTTLLGNGSHQISLQITKTDNSVVNEATTIITDNPQSALAPFKRWVRLNSRSAISIGIIFAVIVIGILLLEVIKRTRLHKRLLNFHGF